jgi:poly(3-hydroxybutyrate) depolymerase
MKSLYSLLLVAVSAFAGTWHSEEIAGMQVELFTPSSVSQVPGKRSFLIHLHGCTQDGMIFRKAGNWENAAEKYGMVVALPTVPNGGVLLGCWDYYDTNHTRDSRHDGYVIRLAQELIQRSSLQVDPRQVYVSGLSAGATEAMVVGCLAPDIFAGVAAAAGPAIGTDSMQVQQLAADVSGVVKLCKKFAGPYQSELSSQVASLIYGDYDFVCQQKYNRVSAEAYARLFSTFGQPSQNAIAGQGAESLWSDSRGPRVSLIAVSGMSHAWPAGGGPGGSFIDTQHVNYPQYLAGFFSRNNRRVPHYGIDN